jgi:small subunit ribosomal protein S6e
MEFKINIGDPKTGKTHKKVFKDDECTPLLNKKLRQTVTGDSLGMPGYEFTITGGSDFCGFPMRSDVEGSARKKVLLVDGVGFRNDRKGFRRRKTVAGNTIYAKTAQINLSILKHGKEPLAEAKAEGAEGEAPAETKEEKPKKEKKEKK